jgi:hypothetical protein
MKQRHARIMPHAADTMDPLGGLVGRFLGYVTQVQWGRRSLVWGIGWALRRRTAAITKVQLKLPSRLVGRWQTPSPHKRLLRQCQDRHSSFWLPEGQRALGRATGCSAEDFCSALCLVVVRVAARGISVLTCCHIAQLIRPLERRSPHTPKPMPIGLKRQASAAGELSVIRTVSFPECHVGMRFGRPTCRLAVARRAFHATMRSLNDRAGFGSRHRGEECVESSRAVRFRKLARDRGTPQIGLGVQGGGRVQRGGGPWVLVLWRG